MNTVNSPRLLVPDRTQGVLFTHSFLDDFVEQAHPVRAVWGFVERLDMSPFLDAVGSRDGGVGRPAVDPRLLLALWMYATVDAVDSGRKLARLCTECLPYRWLCGGVAVEYHTLNDFRSGSASQLRSLLSTGITALVAEGLVTLDTIALDGVRVRASAGSGSFRTAKRLRSLSEAVDQRVAELMEGWQRDGVDPDDPTSKRKIREMSERKARLDRAAGLAEALDKVRAEKLANNKKMNKEVRRKAEAALARGSRVSPTDPEAATLRMADDGFRPAFNAFVCTEGSHGLVVDVNVTADPTDNAEAPKAVERVRGAYGGTVAKNMLADSGFRSEAVISVLDARGVVLLTPLPKVRGAEPAALRPSRQPTAMDRWRERMGSAEGAALYKSRARLIEFAFAGFRNRGLKQYRVRGGKRCEAVTLLHSLTHNMVVVEGLRRKAEMAA